MCRLSREMAYVIELLLPGLWRCLMWSNQSSALLLLLHYHNTPPLIPVPSYILHRLSLEGGLPFALLGGSPTALLVNILI